jgi:hypothetical protein
LFIAKKGWKSIFHSREDCIMSRLDISIWYPGLKKYRVSPQNTKGVRLSFYEKCMFVMKISPKFVFYTREAYILARLDIMLLYTIFGGF